MSDIIINITSMIQRAIENNTFKRFQELEDHIVHKSKGKVKSNDTMKYCQRMVRKKQLHHEVVKGLDGFIPNPHPNRKK
tara:strand:+ start:267 stop:503 length:237 start_codon:yes stop_codon:yes gene_type:complete